MTLLTCYYTSLTYTINYMTYTISYMDLRTCPQRTVMQQSLVALLLSLQALQPCMLI